MQTTCLDVRLVKCRKRILSSHVRTAASLRHKLVRQQGLTKLRAMAGANVSRILQPQAYKRRLHHMWEIRGPTYDDSDTFHNSLATRLVDLATLRTGDKIIDIASGTGMVAIPAAQKVGKAGRVVGIDISESMLNAARSKARELNVSNCSFVQADAETADFPMETYDAIFCSSAMLYMQEIPLALTRFQSWLKPGGYFYFNTPQEPCVPATAVFYEVLYELKGIRLADAAAPLADPERVRTACLQAGFKSITVNESGEVIPFLKCGPEEYAEKMWEALALNALMTPLDGIISSQELEESVKPRYLEQVITMAAPWAVAGDIENPYTMLWVIAQKGY